jgi:hypothetical protein
METATEVARGHREFLYNSYKSEVPGTALDLAYQACVRSTVIGMAHYILHHNWGKYADHAFKAGEIEEPTIKGLYDAFGFRGVFAVVFDLTQQAAIDEQSMCNKAIAGMVVQNTSLLKRIAGNTPMEWYPKTVPAVSPRGMSGSFSSFMKNIRILAEDNDDDGIHTYIAKRVSEIEACSLLDKPDYQAAAEHLGYGYRRSGKAYYKYSGITTRKDDETWHEYFIRKASMILIMEGHEEYIAHIFSDAHRTNLENTGMLFAILTMTEELPEFEEFMQKRL